MSGGSEWCEATPSWRGQGFSKVLHLIAPEAEISPNPRSLENIHASCALTSALKACLSLSLRERGRGEGEKQSKPSLLPSPPPSPPLPLGEEGSPSIWKTVLVVQLRNSCY